MTFLLIVVIPGSMIPLLYEFNSAISSFKRRSARSRPNRLLHYPRDNSCCLLLLDIYNDLFSQGFFPSSWNSSQVFLKPDGKGLRPIALTSCFFKILERMIYRRLQWLTESYFIFPEFQAGFRNSCSCIDNLVANHIQFAFLHRDSIIATFLDIAEAFDNVIPRILFQDLRET